MIKINIVFTSQELQKLRHLPSYSTTWHCSQIKNLSLCSLAVTLYLTSWNEFITVQVSVFLWGVSLKKRWEFMLPLWEDSRVQPAPAAHNSFYFVPAHYLPPEADVFLYIPHINSNFNKPRPRLHAHLFESEMISVSVCHMKALKMLLYG